MLNLNIQLQFLREIIQILSVFTEKQIVMVSK